MDGLKLTEMVVRLKVSARPMAFCMMSRVNGYRGLLLLLAGALVSCSPFEDFPLAKILGCCQVICECDAAILSNLPCCSIEPCHPLLPLLRDWQILIHRDWTCKLQHSYGEANFCADTHSSIKPH